jgi:hypothetical protein
LISVLGHHLRQPRHRRYRQPPLEISPNARASLQTARSGQWGLSLGAPPRLSRVGDTQNLHPRRVYLLSAYSGRKLPRMPVETCHRFQSKVATDADGKLPVIPVETCHSSRGYWSTTRRRDNPIGMWRLAHLSEGGAEASTEVINASSAKSLTAHMGLWSERPHDCPQRTGQFDPPWPSTCGGRRRQVCPGPCRIASMIPP